MIYHSMTDQFAIITIMNIHDIMKTMNFVTIDFETAKCSLESACAIGMVKFVDGKPADTYYSLIRPPSLDFHPYFTEFHGLNIEDVRDAPTFDKIWDDVRAFIDDNVLVAHNRHFEISVLNAVRKWYNLDTPTFDQIWGEAKEFVGDNLLGAEDASFVIRTLYAVLKCHDPMLETGYFCTSDLARKTWHDLEPYTLKKLAAHFGIIYNAHNALDDALTCGKIVLLAAEKFGSTNLKELLEDAYANRPWK